MNSQSGLYGQATTTSAETIGDIRNRCSCGIRRAGSRQHDHRATSARASRVNGCSCPDVERAHKLYALGYYLVGSWSDDQWVRTDVALHLACGYEVTSLSQPSFKGVSGEHPAILAGSNLTEAATAYAAAGGTTSGPYPAQRKPFGRARVTRVCVQSPTWASLRVGNRVQAMFV